MIKNAMRDAGGFCCDVGSKENLHTRGRTGDWRLSGAGSRDVRFPVFVENGFSIKGRRQKHIQEISVSAHSTLVKFAVMPADGYEADRTRDACIEPSNRGELGPRQALGSGVETESSQHACCQEVRPLRPPHAAGPRLTAGGRGA